MRAAAENRRVKVYLTSLGGGAFGNPHEWIADAINEALDMFESHPIDVYQVHYRMVDHRSAIGRIKPRSSSV